MKCRIQKIILFVVIVCSFLSVSGQKNEISKSLTFTVTASGEKEFFNDLKADNVEVYLDNKRAEIISLKQLNEPASIGIVIDTSASMRDYQSGKRDQMTLAVKGFLNFLEKTNVENEYFVVSFDKKVNFAADLTQDKTKIKDVLTEILQNKLNAKETVFFEAVKAAYEKIENAKYQRKVLIFITDGQDNASEKLDSKDIERIAKQGNSLVYAFRNLNQFYGNYSTDNQFENLIRLKTIPVFQRDKKRIKATLEPYPADFPGFGFSNLDILCEITGGRVFYPLNEAETNTSFEFFAEELKSQYELGITAASNLKINDFNEIKLKFVETKKHGKILLRAKKGFYF